MMLWPKLHRNIQLCPVPFFAGYACTNVCSPLLSLLHHPYTTFFRRFGHSWLQTDTAIRNNMDQKGFRQKGER